MTQDEFCRQCSQKRDCKKVYEQLGNSKTPSILRQVILAFFLPVVIFISFLAIFEKTLKDLIESKPLQTLISILLAASVTAVYLFIVKTITKKFGADK